MIDSSERILRRTTLLQGIGSNRQRVKTSERGGFTIFGHFITGAAPIMFQAAELILKREGV